MTPPPSHRKGHTTMSERVNRLGTGSLVIVGPRVSREVFEAIVGEIPEGTVANGWQAVLVKEADVQRAMAIPATDNPTRADVSTELGRVDDELRKAGIEYPLGDRGVHDLASMLAGFREEVDGILTDAGLPYAATGVAGVQALSNAFAAARSEVHRLDEEVQRLRKVAAREHYGVEDTIAQPVFTIPELEP